MLRANFTSGFTLCSCSSWARNSPGHRFIKQRDLPFDGGKVASVNNCSLLSRSATPPVRLAALPSSASVTNIFSRCSRVSGLNWILNVKRRSAASSIGRTSWSCR